MRNITARIPLPVPQEYFTLENGMRIPPCKSPCTTTKGTTQLALTAKGKPTAILSFKKQMAVTVTDFTPFSLSIFLSNVGGSLGLWLGLGLLQLGELTIKPSAASVTQLHLTNCQL